MTIMTTFKFKAMKSIHISKMERLRSINLRIGLAAAIVFALFAFNWTTKRPAPIAFEEEAYPTEMVLKPFTISEPRAAEQPPATVLKPNDIILEVPELVVAGLLPSLIPTDSSSYSNEEPGNVAVAAPIIPKAPPLPPDENTGNPPWIIVEEMPRFSGCEDMDLTKKERSECASNRMIKFLYENIRYPEMARTNGIEGTVYLKFVVEKDGSISNAKIMRDIGGGCGQEALRVVGNMPKWLPGKQQGRAVRVQFSMPVKFKLGH